jgi:hypothetical protein
MGVGCKQLACHTRLHRVHSVSRPPSSHASHWSFLAPFQCSADVLERQSLAIMWPVFVGVLALTLRFPRRRCSAPPMWPPCGVCVVLRGRGEGGGDEGACLVWSDWCALCVVCVGVSVIPWMCVTVACALLFGARFMFNSAMPPPLPLPHLSL